MSTLVASFLGRLKGTGVAARLKWPVITSNSLKGELDASSTLSAISGKCLGVSGFYFIYDDIF